MIPIIGVIGDLHMRDRLGYSTYISDRREKEKTETLDFIVKTLAKCKYIVFMGDNFHSRNNTSEVNRELVALLERFSDKEIFIISGNHEKKENGKTAIDFLKESHKPNWHVYTHPSSYDNGVFNMNFLPYMLNSELDVDNFKDGSKKIMDSTKGKADILFAHHAISSTSFRGIQTDTLTEIVLPKSELEERYKLVFAGHIHEPRRYGKTIVTGSVFNNEAGDIDKYLWIVNDDLSVKDIRIPQRGIYKLENPTIESLEDYPKNSIVKVVVSDKNINIEDLNKSLKRFDASVIIEQYPSDRTKINILSGGAMDLSVNNLLKLYSENKEGVNLKDLMMGLTLIQSD